MSDARRFLVRHWLGASMTAGALVAGAIGFLVGERRFGAERVEAMTQIETYRQVLSDAAEKSKSRPALDVKLQSLADRMLGPTLETVDSEVRRRLNRACEELGLTDFSVTTGTSIARPTPAKKEFKSPDMRKLAESPDFNEVQATVIASGSVESMYRLLFRIDAEPWMKRIESIRLNPNADGQVIRMTVRLTTPFMQGEKAKAPLVFDPKSLQFADRYAALFGANPFRIPPPPAPPPSAVAGKQGGGAAAPSTTPPTSVAPSQPQQPVATGPFPYGEWVITGIVEGPSGPEAWMRHVQSGATLALLPGASVGELVFRRVEYDFAVFDSPSGPCRIQVGTNLTQRSSVAG
jgi:hypothetical protein